MIDIMPGAKICLIGIGGVSMQSLAFALKKRGHMVWGSDRADSDIIRALEADGIRVVHEHRADTVDGADIVIRTAAVHDDNPEIIRARELGIPVLERAEAWGKIMAEYKNVVCFSGCHGKSTSTGFGVHIALAAALDPSVMIGASLPVIDGYYRIGGGDVFVAEACEYCDSFLQFPSTVAVINNIEADHLDYFKTFENVKRSFRRFADNVPPVGIGEPNTHRFPGVQPPDDRFKLLENTEVFPSEFSLSSNGWTSGKLLAPDGEEFSSDFRCGRRSLTGVRQGGQNEKHRKEPPSGGAGSTPRCHGCVVANRDSEAVRDTLLGYAGRVVWYGLGEDADVTATDIDSGAGFPEFTLSLGGESRRVNLKIPGTYNIYNALGAAAAFAQLGVSIDDIAAGLSAFGGIGRRFEYIGEVNGAPVIDDYAHHPTALRELLTSVRGMGYGRIILAFQSHTYSRTAEFYEEFKASLAMADVVLLAPVYAAREVNIYGVDMAKMAAEIPGAEYINTFEGIAARVREIAKPGDVVLTVGAGEIWHVNKLLT
jgi:UDP-N-acetylmuramate-alanine ligase